MSWLQHLAMKASNSTDSGHEIAQVLDQFRPHTTTPITCTLSLLLEMLNRRRAGESTLFCMDLPGLYESQRRKSRWTAGLQHEFWQAIRGRDIKLRRLKTPPRMCRDCLCFSVAHMVGELELYEHLPSLVNERVECTTRIFYEKRWGMIWPSTSEWREPCLVVHAGRVDKLTRTWVCPELRFSTSSVGDLEIVSYAQRSEDDPTSRRDEIALNRV